MSDERDEGGGFKVTDRRRFASSGEPKAASDEPTSPASEAATPDPQAADARQAVTFASFVMGLSTQALMYLGEIPTPSGDEPSRDLAAAQHLIDVLAVLEAKTTGNLAAEEAGLLEAVLYDLRMRYVAIAKQPGRRPEKEPS